MSTRYNTTTDVPYPPARAGEFTRHGGLDEVEEALREGKVLQIGGFPKHIVNAYLDDQGELVFGFAEDEVQAKVNRTDKSFAQLVTEFGSDKAFAILQAYDPDLQPHTYDIRLIGALGFNL